MAKKPKMSGLNSCDDLENKIKSLQDQIKNEDISIEEKKLLPKQIKILHEQWLKDCAPKGKRARRV